MKNTERIYIIVPGIIENFPKEVIETQFLKSLDNSLHYEVDARICAAFKRTYLFKHKMVVKSDEFYPKETVKLTNYQANFYLSKHLDSKIGLVIIEIKQYDEHLTAFLDQSSREGLVVEIEGQEIALTKFLMDQINFKIVGKTRKLVTTLNQPSETVCKAILSSESIESETDFGGVRNKELDTALSNDLSSYEFVSLYAYRTCVLEVLHNIEDFKGEKEDNAVTLTIFMIEILMYKDAAISSLNETVIQSFKEMSSKIYNRIAENNEKFAKMIDLWEIEIFKYSSTQEEILKLNNAFQIDKSFIKYERNLEFLEKMIVNRKAKVDEKNGLFFNILVLLLSFVQIFTIIYTLVDIKINGAITNVDTISVGIFALITLIFVFGYYLLRKRA